MPASRQRKICIQNNHREAYNVTEVNKGGEAYFTLWWFLNFQNEIINCHVKVTFASISCESCHVAERQRFFSTRISLPPLTFRDILICSLFTSLHCSTLAHSPHWPQVHLFFTASIDWSVKAQPDGFCYCFLRFPLESICFFGLVENKRLPNPRKVFWRCPHLTSLSFFGIS